MAFTITNNNLNDMQQSNAQALPFSAAVPVGDALYISGQVGTDPGTNTLVTDSFGAEARQVMDNIGKVLRNHNLTYGDLVNVTIYLTDMDHYVETNEVYRKYFATTFPARVCIAVKQLPLKANIEISAIARLSPGRER
jgi:reactive intermediate/imine deaminase